MSPVHFKASVNGAKAVVEFRTDEDTEIVYPSDDTGSAPVIEESVVDPPITKRTAVRRRFLKVFGYTTLGVLLSLAGYTALTVLTGFSLPPYVVTVGTVFVSSMAAALHKSIDWVESAGFDAPPTPEPVMPTYSLPTTESDT